MNRSLFHALVCFLLDPLPRVGPAPAVAVDVRLFEPLLHLLCAALGGMEDFVERRFWADDGSPRRFLLFRDQSSQHPMISMPQGNRIRLKLHLLC